MSESIDRNFLEEFDNVMDALEAWDARKAEEGEWEKEVEKWWGRYMGRPTRSSFATILAEYRDSLKASGKLPIACSVEEAALTVHEAIAVRLFSPHNKDGAVKDIADALREVTEPADCALRRVKASINTAEKSGGGTQCWWGFNGYYGPSVSSSIHAKKHLEGLLAVIDPSIVVEWEN
jgi:hypothetical protein